MTTNLPKMKMVFRAELVSNLRGNRRKTKLGENWVRPPKAFIKNINKIKTKSRI